MEGWGGYCLIPRSGMALYSGLWMRDECQLHINVLELRVVGLTLLHLGQEVHSQSVLIESDNSSALSYINRQGGVISKTLNDEMCTLFHWLVLRSIRVRVIHPPGVNNGLASFLSCNHPNPTE